MRSPGKTRSKLGLTLGCCAVAFVGLRSGQAWLFPSDVAKSAPSRQATVASTGRREVLAGIGLGSVWVASAPEAVHASGGSTAGKYSTIPSGKRRFYGRVRQGLYQFLQMEKPIMAGKLQDPTIDEFFAKTLLKNTRDGGKTDKNCGFGADCTVKEKRTSRWLDFKVATDLLASAFRYDANDVNDRLPQVKLIRAAHKKIEKMRLAIEEGSADDAQKLYLKIKNELNKYAYMVELEPLDSEDYTHPWDTAPEVWCQGSFCI
mmetsp:Transcript_41989/g.96419  ORF Transcript_41989/g.96419 Transcript_41989/m.96419 type:complete len:261 (+) Transcript_41989:69-851(+)